MTKHGLAAEVRICLSSIEMGMGFSDLFKTKRDYEMEFEGSIIELTPQFIDSGIDKRAGIGSTVFFSIELGETNTVATSPEIGWMEVYPSGFTSETNPVCFKIRIHLDSSVFQDILALSNFPIRIEPVFSYEDNEIAKGLKKTITGSTVMFNIVRIYFSLAIPN